MALSDARRCTATAKRTGQRCKNPAVTGFTVCRFHGAGSKAHPGGRPVTTGRYSKHLPAGLLDRYQAAHEDPDRQALDDEIALVYARLTQVLDRLHTGESASAWEAARAAHAALVAAVKANDPAGLRAGLGQLGGALERAEDERSTWAEVGDLVERRRRLAESQGKLEALAEQALPAREVMALVALLVDVVRRRADAATAAAIAAEIRGLALAGDAAAPGRARVQ